MNDSDNHPNAVRFVQADRILTGEGADRSQEEKVCVIEEVPVTIDIEGVEVYTLLCTPIDLRELAAGFLLTEGVVERMADIEVLKECDDDPHTIRVRLTDKIPRIDDAGRNLLIVSSCGATNCRVTERWRFVTR